MEDFKDKILDAVNETNLAIEEVKSNKQSQRKGLVAEDIKGASSLVIEVDKIRMEALKRILSSQHLQQVYEPETNELN